MCQFVSLKKTLISFKMLVLLNGLPGSGKDTVAAYLVEKHNFVKANTIDEAKASLEQHAGKSVVMCNYKHPDERSIRATVSKEEDKDHKKVPEFMALRIERNLPQWAQDLKRSLVYMQTRDVDTARQIMVKLGYTDVNESEWKTLCCKVDQVLHNDGSIEELPAKIEASLDSHKLLCIRRKCGCPLYMDNSPEAEFERRAILVRQMSSGMNFPIL